LGSKSRRGWEGPHLTTGFAGEEESYWGPLTDWGFDRPRKAPFFGIKPPQKKVLIREPVNVGTPNLAPDKVRGFAAKQTPARRSQTSSFVNPKLRNNGARSGNKTRAQKNPPAVSKTGRGPTQTIALFDAVPPPGCLCG